MAVPKKKLSRTRSRRRQAANTRQTLIVGLVSCEFCHQPTRPHDVCVHCGRYRGQDLL